VELQQRLRGGKLEPADRVRSLRTVEELHTFHGLINRTRRRDIGNFTIRKAYTKSIKFTRPSRFCTTGCWRCKRNSSAATAAAFRSSSC